MSTDNFTNGFIKNLYSYPNPCHLSTTLVIPKITESAIVEVIDLMGRVMITKEYITIHLNNEIQIALDNLSKGLYLFVVATKEKEQFQTKFIIE